MQIMNPNIGEREYTVGERFDHYGNTEVNMKLYSKCFQ